MDKAGTTAKWIIGILVSVILVLGGYAASALEGRVDKVEDYVDSVPEYVTLQQQFLSSMEHNAIHVEQSEDLAAINAKLDIVLQELGIGTVQ